MIARLAVTAAGLGCLGVVAYGTVHVALSVMAANRSTPRPTLGPVRATPRLRAPDPSKVSANGQAPGKTVGEQS